MDRRMDGRMDGISPYSKGLCPLLEPLPKKEQMKKENGGKIGCLMGARRCSEKEARKTKKRWHLSVGWGRERSEKEENIKQVRTNNDAAFQCNFFFNIFFILWMLCVSIELYHRIPIDFT